MMTKPIPKKMREQMFHDPFYDRCCITGLTGTPNDPIEWHHNFSSYANGNKGRLNEIWCILPILRSVHRLADRRDIREQLDRIMLNRADDETLRKWSRSEDLIAKRDRLNKNEN